MFSFQSPVERAHSCEMKFNVSQMLPKEKRPHLCNPKYGSIDMNDFAFPKFFERFIHSFARRYMYSISMANLFTCNSNTNRNQTKNSVTFANVLVLSLGSKLEFVLIQKCFFFRFFEFIIRILFFICLVHLAQSMNAHDNKKGNVLNLSKSKNSRIFL